MRKGQKQADKEPRKETREDYFHRLAITYHHKLAMEMDRHFGRGEVLNWSNHGLRILSSVPIEEDIEYNVRFHVQKNQGLMGMSRWLSREGKVCWVQKYDSRWIVGIELEEKVEKLNEYIAQEDSCYIFFMSTNSEPPYSESHHP